MTDETLAAILCDILAVLTTRLIALCAESLTIGLELIALRGEADVLRLQRTNRFLKAVEFLLVSLMDLALGAPTFDLISKFDVLRGSLTQKILGHRKFITQLRDDSLTVEDGLSERLSHGAADVVERWNVGVCHCVFLSEFR